MKVSFISHNKVIKSKRIKSIKDLEAVCNYIEDITLRNNLPDSTLDRFVDEFWSNFQFKSANLPVDITPVNTKLKIIDTYFEGMEDLSTLEGRPDCDKLIEKLGEANQIIESYRKMLEKLPIC